MSRPAKPLNKKSANLLADFCVAAQEWGYARAMNSVGRENARKTYGLCKTALVLHIRKLEAAKRRIDKSKRDALAVRIPRVAIP